MNSTYFGKAYEVTGPSQVAAAAGGRKLASTFNQFGIEAKPVFYPHQLKQFVLTETELERHDLLDLRHLEATQQFNQLRQLDPADLDEETWDAVNATLNEIQVEKDQLFDFFLKNPVPYPVDQNGDKTN